MENWEKLIKIRLRADLILLFIPEEYSGVRADIERARESLLYTPPEGAQIFIDEISDIMEDISTIKFLYREPWVETVLTIWTGQRVIL